MWRPGVVFRHHREVRWSALAADGSELHQTRICQNHRYEGLPVLYSSHSYVCLQNWRDEAELLERELPNPTLSLPVSHSELQHFSSGISWPSPSRIPPHLHPSVLGSFVFQSFFLSTNIYSINLLCTIPSERTKNTNKKDVQHEKPKLTVFTKARLVHRSFISKVHHYLENTFALFIS